MNNLENLIDKLINFGNEVEDSLQYNALDNVLFKTANNIYSYNFAEAKKAAYFMSVETRDSDNLICFKDMDFGMKGLFVLQRDFLKVVVNVFNEVYKNYEAFKATQSNIKVSQGNHYYWIS